ncbi:MAG: hypothetical protein INH41_05940 [Myxococcaceae bacterium]|jgi:hypothetical protein|nr:hypothetical protein [Myxococcaceae bacterium]MCA3011927.1 hypothetical protein [Myxococcaceae bacterium]
MTTTKLVATPVASKVPAVARSTTPAASAAVARAEPTATPPAAPTVAFQGAAPPAKADALRPQGAPVSTSADPNALWGAAERRPNPELRAAMTEFRALSPEAQKAKIDELKGRQDALAKKMLVRIEQLDARYKTMRNVSKGEMLRELAGKTEAMSPEQKQHLDGLLDKADGIARQIEALKADAARLPDSKVATPEQRLERQELARKIRNARSRLSEATKAATTYVDSLGLRTERLAVNEQAIDPNAPPKGSPKSLWSMMAEWFDLGSTLKAFVAIFSPSLETSVTKTAREDSRKLDERRALDEKRHQRREDLRQSDERLFQLLQGQRGDHKAQVEALNQALAMLRRTSAT